MSRINKAIGNTVWLYGKLLITSFISFWAVRLLLREMGAVDYGIFNLVSGVIGMLLFLNNTMIVATNRFIACAEGSGIFEEKCKVFNVSFLLHLIIAFAVAVIIEIVGTLLFAHVLNIPEARRQSAYWVFQLMIICVIFSTVMVPYEALITAKEELKFLAVMDICSSVLKLLVAFGLAWFAGDRLLIYAIALSGVYGFDIIGKVLFCLRYPEARLHLRRFVSRDFMKCMTIFAGWSFLGTASNMLASYGKNIILNSFFGVLINAAEGIATQLSGQLLCVMTSMFRAINPVIMKSESGGDSTYAQKLAVSSGKLSFFMLVFVVCPVFWETKYIFILWLGKIPDYTIIFSRLILIRALVNQITYPLLTLISAQGRIKGIQMSEAGVYLGSLPIMYGLLWLGLQPTVIYYYFIFMVCILTGVRMYFAHRLCALNLVDYTKRVLGKCFASALFVFGLSAIPFFLMPDGFLRLLVVGTISSLSCMLYVFLWGLESFERKKCFGLCREFYQKWMPGCKFSF